MKFCRAISSKDEVSVRIDETGSYHGTLSIDDGNAIRAGSGIGQELRLVQIISSNPYDRPIMDCHSSMLNDLKGAARTSYRLLSHSNQLTDITQYGIRDNFYSGLLC